MSFSGENQLHWALRIGKETNQPLRIVQEKIGTLIGGKAPRKSHRQHIFIEDIASHPTGFRLLQRADTA